MRRVAAEQLLLASSTTEGQNGGNIRFSTAAVEHAGTEISLVRNATVISYGAQADGIVTIARRANDAAGSDQVLLAITKDDYTLEPQPRLGNARHARHLQRRLRAEVQGHRRTDLSRRPMTRSMRRP